MIEERAKSEERFVRESGLSGELAAVVEPVIEALGFRLVRIVASGRDGGTLQIMAERPDGHLSIDDCATITREIVPVLDVYSGEVRERYAIEVSSPGLDRPLVRPGDFMRHLGCEAKVELKEMRGGRKRLRGRIAGADETAVRLAIVTGDGGSGGQNQNGNENQTERESEKEWSIAFSDIASAKLMISDALLDAVPQEPHKRSRRGGS